MIGSFLVLAANFPNESIRHFISNYWSSKYVFIWLDKSKVYSHLFSTSFRPSSYKFITVFAITIGTARDHCVNKM